MTDVLDMVMVHSVADPYKVNDRDTVGVPWREGMVVGDLDDPDYDNMEVYLNGRLLGPAWKDEAVFHPQSHVNFVRAAGKAGTDSIISSAANLGGRVNHAFYEAWSGVAARAKNPWKYAREIRDWLRPPFPPRPTPDRSQGTFGWSGPFTNYNPVGLPIPLPYGEHRVGGAAIIVFTEVVDGEEPEQFLNLILLLGSGPIESIGQYSADQDGLTGSAIPEGMEINGNNAQNFDDVTVHLRMGSFAGFPAQTIGSQSPMPGFTFVPTEYPVDLLVDNVSDSSGLSPVSDWSMAAVFDMPLGALSDRSTVTLFFPNGLFRISNTGKKKTETVDIQVRYIELNGVGNEVGPWAIATGPDAFSVTAKNQSAFAKQINFIHYDPLTFTAQVVGSARRFLDQNNHRATDVFFGHPSGTAYPPNWRVPGTRIQAFTFTTHLRINEAGMKDRHPILSIADWDETVVPTGGVNLLGGGVEGLIVCLERHDGTSGPDADFGLSVMLGSSLVSAQLKMERMGEVDLADEVHIAVTYEEDAQGAGNNRVRAYLNGVVVGEVITSIDLIVTNYTPPANHGKLLLNTLPNKEGVAEQWHGHMDWDETCIYTVAKTPTDISVLHNQGLWQSRSQGVPGSEGPSLDPTMAIGWTLNTQVTDPGPGGVFYQNFHPSFDSQHLTQFGSSIPALTTGLVITTSATNQSSRKRWRIQVQRTDVVKQGLSNSDTTLWQSLTTKIDELIGYRGRALVGLRVKATDQLSGGLPRVTVIQKGVKNLPIWDGADPDNPSFSFAYSANPAWQLAHLYLDKERGAGHVYSTNDIDWASFKVWADHCDVLVYDMFGKFGFPHGQTGLSFFWVSSTRFEILLDLPIAAGHVPGKFIRIANATSGDVPEGDFQINPDLTFGYPVYPFGLSGQYKIECITTGLSSFTSVNQDATADMVGLEPRIRSNLVFDERGVSFQDARDILTANGRARIVNFGSIVTAVVDQARQPVAVFNAANVIGGSFTMASASSGQRSNTATAEIQNARHNYARDVILLDHESLEDGSSTINVRRVTYDLRGTTYESQALREVRLRLNRSNQISLAAGFRAASDGLLLDVGDVFLLAHPVPQWEDGGRCLQDSDNDSVDAGIYADHDFAIGTLNCIEQSSDLSDAAVWNIVAGSSWVSFVLDPDGINLIGNRISFPSGGSFPRFDQVIPNRGPGSIWTMIIWARLVSGNADAVDFALVADDGFGSPTNIAVSSPTLTAGFVRYTLTGTTVASYSLDPNLRVRIVQANGSAADIAVAWIRVIRGPDDFLDARQESRESTTTFANQFAVVANADDDNAVSFKQTLISGGGVLEGELVRVTTGFGFIPRKEWMWCIGPAAYGARQFEITSINPKGDQSVDIECIEYDATVYPDEDDWPTLAPDPGNASASLLSDSEDDILPDPVKHLSASEESSRDDVTGSLEKGINVGWSGASANVDRYRIWLRGAGGTELAGETSANQTEFRIPGHLLDQQNRYWVYVQPITRSGLRLGLKRASGARLFYYGLHPPPDAASAVRALLHGEMATYEADLPVGFQAAVTEIFRGGTFLGQSLGRIPVGGSHFGPTTDWCVLNAGADLRKDPPLLARLSTAQGSRGPCQEVSGTLVPAGYTDLLDDSMEDGPWATAGTGYTEAPILTNLVAVTPTEPPGAPEMLTFTGSNLVGNYQSTIYDLGRPRLTHVSFGVFGAQVSPDTLLDLPPLGALRARSWSPEGYLDPGHASYGRVDTVLLWAHSATAADPGTEYERFRCGPHYIRSCRFKIEVTRPASTWDVNITRAAVVIRNPPHSTDVDAGGVS